MLLPFAIGMPGPPEMLILLVIVVVLFGANKVPGIARSLGRSLGEFKKGRDEGGKLASEKVKELIDDIKKEDVVEEKEKVSEETKA
jgi:sec-independent protein translocase protein TatA